MVAAGCDCVCVCPPVYVCVQPSVWGSLCVFVCDVVLGIVHMQDEVWVIFCICVFLSCVCLSVSVHVCRREVAMGVAGCFSGALRVFFYLCLGVCAFWGGT